MNDKQRQQRFNLFLIPNYSFLIISLCIVHCALCIVSCASSAASAEEYYEIGMAYFEFGKYAEAEKWLNRAKQADRTMSASVYNLGRIAFEQKRYEEASKHFESILKKDPDNILALRAAAFSRIRSGDIEAAEKHYAKLFELVPESADDGYNRALILYAMNRFEEAEEVLDKYPFAKEDNKDVLLLYARISAANDKIEAIDLYSLWLENNTDAKVRFEYAEILEKNEFYAKALEEYRQALTEVPSAGSTIKKEDIHFAIAKVLLIADGASAEGITELETAVREGFNNIEKTEELANDTRISASHRESIRTIINNLQRAEDEAAKAEEENALSEENEDAPEQEEEN